MVLIACLPLGLTLFYFAIGLPGWQTGLLTLLATLFFALSTFQMRGAAFAKASLNAGTTTLTTLAIVLPALLLAALVERSGGGRLLAENLPRSERPLVVLFLVVGLSPLLEAVCGFGTGIVVTVPLFLSLDLPPRTAALLGLLGESTTAFASMGNAIGLEASLTGLSSQALGMETAILVFPFSLLCVCLALWLTGGTHALRQWGLVAAGAASLLAFGEWLWSASLGADSAGMLSALVTGGFLWGLLSWRQEKAVRPAWRSWSPMVVSGALVLGSQLLFHGPLGRFLVLTNAVAILGNPGLWLFLACGSVVLLRKDPALLSAAWKITSTRFVHLGTTLAAFLLTASILSSSGMIDAVTALFDPFHAFYTGVAPLLGAIGGWMTGSTVSSNALLSTMQLEMALHLHLNVVWIAAAQNAASSFGRLLAPGCVLLAATAANVAERDVFFSALFLVLLALCGLEVLFALMFAAPFWSVLLLGWTTVLLLRWCLHHLVHHLERKESYRCSPLPLLAQAQGSFATISLRSKAFGERLWRWLTATPQQE